MPEVYCKYCKEECGTIEIDMGIGPHEYGSVRAADVRLETVSDCCEAEVLKEAPEDD